jgi:hypothetical protein
MESLFAGIYWRLQALASPSNALECQRRSPHFPPQ